MEVRNRLLTGLAHRPRPPAYRDTTWFHIGHSRWTPAVRTTATTRWPDLPGPGRRDQAGHPPAHPGRRIHRLRARGPLRHVVRCRPQTRQRTGGGRTDHRPSDRPRTQDPGRPPGDPGSPAAPRRLRGHLAGTRRQARRPPRRGLTRHRRTHKRKEAGHACDISRQRPRPAYPDHHRGVPGAGPSAVGRVHRSAPAREVLGTAHVAGHLHPARRVPRRPLGLLHDRTGRQPRVRVLGVPVGGRVPVVRGARRLQPRRRPAQHRPAHHAGGVHVRRDGHRLPPRDHHLFHQPGRARAAHRDGHGGRDPRGDGPDRGRGHRRLHLRRRHRHAVATPRRADRARHPDPARHAPAGLGRPPRAGAAEPVVPRTRRLGAGRLPGRPGARRDHPLRVGPRRRATSRPSRPSRTGPS